MKIQTLTVRYGAKRTHDFQSADVGAEMTVQIEAGETIETVFAIAQTRLRKLVDEQADKAIRDLANDASAMRRR